MSKYMITAHYTPGSWARLVKSTDDRTEVVRSAMESLGGSLDHLYWTASNGAAHAVGDFPDLVAARAFVTAIFKTGAFRRVKVHEVLDQEQLRDTLVLSQSTESVYSAPGQAALDPAMN